MSPTETAELYGLAGPFVTIYLPAPSARRHADELLALRWRSLRKVLASRGADEADLVALDAAVAQGHGGGVTLAAVAAHGQLVLREMMSETLPRRVGDVGELPMLAPLLVWRQGVVCQLIVTADRVGAELAVVEGARPTQDLAVVGETEQVHKPQAGGWSQGRYQRRAEHTWDRNAAGVADEVTALVHAHGVEVVHLAGDERALGYLSEHLSAPIRELTRRAEGAIDPDGVEVRHAAASLRAQRTVAVLGEFAQRRGRHDRAVEGVRATCDALGAGRVETLLVHASTADQRRGWFGDTAVPIAPDARTATRAGIVHPRRGRLIEVAIRAAFGTAASVWFVPHHGPDGPTEGIGALTRFDL